MTARSINVLGVKIHRLTMAETIEVIDNFIKSRRMHYVVTPNPEILMKATTDDEYRTILNNADLALPDGIGVVWAGKVAAKESRLKNLFLRKFYFLGYAIINLLAIVFAPRSIFDVFPERVSGSDIIWKLARLCAQNRYSVFFLGGMPGVAEKTAQKLKALHPDLKVAGTYAGYPKENSLADRIRVAKPDILFVAYGSPKQEKFIAENLLKLSTPVAIGVGGAFDFIAGKARRAPKIMRKLGLEWLWRLISQPKRIKRILLAFPCFVGALISWKLGQGQGRFQVRD